MAFNELQNSIKWRGMKTEKQDRRKRKNIMEAFWITAPNSGYTKCLPQTQDRHFI